MKKILLFCLFYGSIFIHANNHPESKDLASLVSSFRQEILESFEASTSSFHYINHLAGGAGGVHKLKDQNGKMWVLKAWPKADVGISELIAHYLLDGLSGLNRLKGQFFVARSLPESVVKSMPGHLWDAYQKNALFALIPFVESIPSNDIELKKHLRQNFINLAFLSVWDLTPDNMILAKDGLHFVDTGGSLKYRALGLSKAISPGYHPFRITEFTTLPLHHNEFKNIFLEEKPALLQQMSTLIQAGSLILERVDLFCRALNSTNRLELLAMLAERLNHLVLVYNSLTKQWDEEASTFLLSGPMDAAGTLLFSEDPITKEKVTLMGQRRGHAWFSNLGGMANEREFAHTAAARETFEESGKLYNLPPHKLVHAPSHDLITIHNDFRIERFRTYAQLVDYVDESKFHDDEYTRYVWVPVAHLLDALNKNKTITEEGQQTISVDGLIIYPPLLASFRQARIKQWLELVYQNKTLPLKHTQSLHDQISLGHPLKQAPHYYFSHPAIHQSELANSFTNSEKFVPKEANCPLKKEKGASHHMLDFLVGKKQISPDLTISQKIAALYKDRLTLKDHQINLIEAIITEEQKYPEHYVMYHALRSDIFLAYRVLSYIQNFFEANQELQTQVVRSSNSFFESIKNGQDLLEFIKNNRTDDANPRFLAAGISCNPTLFSNLEWGGEETINYFFNNVSIAPPKDIWSILTLLFRDLAIPAETLQKELIQLYDDFFGSPAHRPGALLQFFVEKTKAREAAYISNPGGGLVYDQNGDIIKNTETVLQEFSLGNEINFPGISYNEIQTRLHAHLTDIKVKSYLSDNTNIQQLDKLISSLLDPYLELLATNIVRNKTIYKKPTLVQKVISDLLSFENTEENPEDVRFTKAFEENNFVLIKKYFIDPSFNNVALLEAGTLETYNVPDNFISLFRKTSDKTLKKWQIHFKDVHYKVYIENIDFLILKVEASTLADADFYLEAIPLLAIFKQSHRTFPAVAEAIQNFYVLADKKFTGLAQRISEEAPEVKDLVLVLNWMKESPPPALKAALALKNNNTFPTNFVKLVLDLNTFGTTPELLEAFALLLPRIEEKNRSPAMVESWHKKLANCSNPAGFSEIIIKHAITPRTPHLGMKTLDPLKEPKNCAQFLTNFERVQNLLSSEKLNLLDVIDILYMDNPENFIEHLPELINSCSLYNDYKDKQIINGIIDDIQLRKLPNYESTFKFLAELINAKVNLNKIQTIIWRDDFEQCAQNLLRTPRILKKLEHVKMEDFQRDYLVTTLSTMSHFEAILDEFFAQCSYEHWNVANKLAKFLDKKQTL